MGLINIRLGDYIERSTINNKDLKYGGDLIVGVNSQGVFATPKGNTDGVDLKPYKIVENGAFVYNPTRLELGSIAYRTEGLCIVSHLYMVFYLTDEGKKIIDPMWLYIYFRRSEFCREVKFRNFGSQRPEFNFNDMSDIIIPLPNIEIQKKYVDVYNAMIENQKSYECGLEGLKLVCDVYIEDLRKQMPCEAIGPYIQVVNESNVDNEVAHVQGVESSGSFMDTRANMQGVDISKYTIVNKGYIAYNPSRINIGSIAMYTNDEPCVVSPMYSVFKIINIDKVLPEYLMLWFSRTEFQRYTWYYAAGSVRDTFDFNLMQQVEFPIPDIEIQQDIVNIFETYNTRRDINEKLKEQIKDICPILIKGSIEEARKAKEA
ncbi:restriction endonuclease subunit S [Blautia intestinalis]|uniref:restriction endonuclease subunit S n=1 Tax=Blautia intestinalis TaxID=2763028 RepID=UPI0022DF8D24|nr:restriction endonuclease subunit S [Blautia intestinalis]